MNKDLYEKVVDGCALLQDINIWSDGDLTMVEERGINLSGGQKQRIQLVRAVYNDSDIYFLGDPFSAVDAHRGSHLFKRNQDSFDIPPSENDVRIHMALIHEATERDTDLTKSKVHNSVFVLYLDYLLNFIGKTCSNEDFHDEEEVVVDEEKEVEEEVEEEEKEEEEEEVEGLEANDKSDGEGELNVDEEQNIGYDTVCAICDNGGEILPCEGRCLRSFHATIEAGRDSFCDSLGYTITQVNVFPCVTANCGHYYHPKCVARLLYPGTDPKQEAMRKNIATEKTFVCPLHICSLCRKGENRNVHDLQFAMCRRCPKAYHRKCLPKEIIIWALSRGLGMIFLTKEF
ncbi:protein ENHANCED DOWNY MILDEW 2-like [Trifolium pratense]|uniref:protein ENHANCED DOWNY MILDEW 2-like n=1 Tax=Trifolium pratense TaxID=57577 RepID=UPI001E696B01|nr:protein ENHANCED DOWNY MILDEW 2-like [Trifolium pratense]